MEVIPAIDLRNGKCVRLFQGDYSKETVFSEDPVATAQKWESMGASRLHVVDLDGAARGESGNLPVVDSILRALRIPVQLGGGLRTIGDIERVLALGVKRAILGTAAVEEPELVAEACRRFGEAIIVGVDAKEGYVATRGWIEGTRITAVGLMQKMAVLGARRFIYTDVARDGTLTEPNFESIAALVKETSLPILAAGGIASVDHLTRLAELGVEGAIVGKALYAGNVDLREAISAVSACGAATKAMRETGP